MDSKSPSLDALRIDRSQAPLNAGGGGIWWKWGQGANFDRSALFPRLPACRAASVLNFPVPFTT